MGDGPSPFLIYVAGSRGGGNGPDGEYLHPLDQEAEEAISRSKGSHPVEVHIYAGESLRDGEARPLTMSIDVAIQKELRQCNETTWSAIGTIIADHVANERKHTSF